MKIKAAIFATTFILAGLGPLQARADSNTPSTSPPAAPQGYNWYNAKNGVGNFLLPQGWQTREEVKGDTRALLSRATASLPAVSSR